MTIEPPTFRVAFGEDTLSIPAEQVAGAIREGTWAWVFGGILTHFGIVDEYAIIFRAGEGEPILITGENIAVPVEAYDTSACTMRLWPYELAVKLVRLWPVTREILDGPAKIVEVSLRPEPDEPAKIPPLTLPTERPYAELGLLDDVEIDDATLVETYDSGWQPVIDEEVDPEPEPLPEPSPPPRRRPLFDGP